MRGTEIKIAKITRERFEELDGDWDSLDDDDWDYTLHFGKPEKSDDILINENNSEQFGFSSDFFKDVDLVEELGSDDILIGVRTDEKGMLMNSDSGEPIDDFAHLLFVRYAIKYGDVECIEVEEVIGVQSNDRETLLVDFEGDSGSISYFTIDAEGFHDLD